MTKQEMRRIASGATRSYLRSMNFTIVEMTADVALGALDDLARSEPNLIAGQWWNEASDNQVRLFKKEWRGWYAKEKQTALAYGSAATYAMWMNYIS